jgi:hypothetical protein
VHQLILRALSRVQDWFVEVEKYPRIWSVFSRQFLPCSPHAAIATQYFDAIWSSNHTAAILAGPDPTVFIGHFRTESFQSRP